ncbi:flagellar protein [Bacillus sp. AFS073361]|uniref:flagellar protein n=1 Tax=Bacillus sp. AFS073361 TaxID=2033511 RepID=UPI000BF81A71|nr:flagellar protein [Bacillus sp. AFS073361]
MGTPKLGNCPKCRKLFLRTRDLCDACYQKQEDDYLKASAYLRENPGSTIQEVSDKTMVSVTQIRHFIVARRIFAGQFPNLSYPCETCGEMIRTGRTCNSCMDTLNQLAAQLEKNEGQQHNKHHLKVMTQRL